MPKHVKFLRQRCKDHSLSNILIRRSPDYNELSRNLSWTCFRLCCIFFEGEVEQWFDPVCETCKQNRFWTCDTTNRWTTKVSSGTCPKWKDPTDPPDCHRDHTGYSTRAYVDVSHCTVSLYWSSFPTCRLFQYSKGFLHYFGDSRILSVSPDKGLSPRTSTKPMFSRYISAVTFFLYILYSNFICANLPLTSCYHKSRHVKTCFSLGSR